MKKYLPFYLLLFFILSSCADKDINDLKRFVAAEKKQKAGRIEPLPEFVEYKMYTYNSADLRDPFVPVVNVEVVAKQGYTGPTPDENRIKEPLESFALDSLRMMGILQQDNTTWVLIKDPDGLLHRVTTGNYLGLNNGKIVNIEEDSIDIVELVPNGRGWEERKAGMTLNE